MTIFWIALLGGLILALLILIFAKSIFLKLPLLAVTFWFLIDAAIAPLATQAFGLTSQDPTIVSVGFAQSSEYPLALLGVSAHYLAVIIGVLWGWRFFQGTRNQTTRPTTSAPALSSDSSRLTPRLYKGSFLVCLAGLLAQGYILSTLLQTTNLLDLASSRLLFTSELAATSALYNYALLFAPFMRLGAWGMLLHSQNREQRYIALALNIIYLLLAILYGGRTDVVVSFFMLVLIYAYRTQRKISLAVFGPLAIAATGLLGSVTLIRYGVTSLTGFVRYTGGYLFFDRRLEQVAFALRSFPNVFAFYDGRTLWQGLQLSIPGLSLPNATNLFRDMMWRLYGSTFEFAGIGGSNYANAAENFMNFGWWGIVLVPLLAGFVFGLVFKWSASREPTALFILLFMTAFMHFFNGQDSKMVASISSLLIEGVLPIGLIVVWALFPAKVAQKLLIIFYFAAVFFLSTRLSGLWFGFRYLEWGQVGLLALSYVYLVQLIHTADFPDMPTDPVRPKRLPLPITS